MVDPNYQLGFTNRNLFRRLKALERGFLIYSGLQIRFIHDIRMPAGSGYVDGLPNGNIRVVLGCDLNSKHDIFSWRRSDIADSCGLNFLYSYFLETTYIDETFDMAQDVNNPALDTAVSLLLSQESNHAGFDMAVSLIAVRNNLNLFTRNQLLFLCVHDARRRALFEFLFYFSCSEKAKSLISSNFLSGGFGYNSIVPEVREQLSLDLDKTSINRMFAASWDIIKLRHMQYDPDIKYSDDEISIALHLFERNANWGYFASKFMHADANTQARMMACVHGYLHPEILQSYRALSNHDISPSAIFGRDFPESRECILRRMPEDYLTSADKKFLCLV